MKRQRTIKQITKDIDKLMSEYSNALEQRVRAFLPQLAKRYPKSTVCFCSAMGTYSFHINNEPVELKVCEPIIKLFDDATGNYSYEPIPVFRAEIEPGKPMRVDYDW